MNRKKITNFLLLCMLLSMVLCLRTEPTLAFLTEQTGAVRNSFACANRFRIEYDGNGGTDAVSNVPAAQEEYSNRNTHNMTLSAEVPVRDGHIFLGWAEVQDSTTPDYAPEAVLTLTMPAGQATVTKTLYAVWGTDQYTLVYHTNGGTFSDTASPMKLDSYNGNGTADSHTFTIISDAPSYGARTFMGWADSASAAYPDYSAAAQSYVDETGTAHPTVNTITLTSTNRVKHVYAVYGYRYELKYDINGGTGEIPQDQTVLTAAESVTFQIPAAPIPGKTVKEANDYNFAYWGDAPTGGTEENQHQAGEPITLTVDAPVRTLYARYQTDKPYTVRFNQNTTQTVQHMPDPQTVIAKSTGDTWDYDVSTAVPTRTDHYIFVGWNTQADGSGEIYAANDLITLVKEESYYLELYAMWEAEPYANFRVILDGNGGYYSFSSNTSLRYTQVYYNPEQGRNYPVGVNSSSASWNRSAGRDPETGEMLTYRLTGWATNPEGTGTIYAVGTFNSYDVPYDAAYLDEDGYYTVKLYAVWEAGPTFRVIQDGNGGYYSSSSNTSLRYTQVHYNPEQGRNYPVGVNSSSAYWRRSETVTVDGQQVTHYYTLAGWSTNQNATAADYPADGTFASYDVPYVSTNLDSDGYHTETLYAVWAKDWVLEYDLQGGSPAIATDTYREIAPNVSDSHTFTVTTTIPTKQDFVFMGWIESSTLSTGSRFYGTVTQANQAYWDTQAAANRPSATYETINLSNKLYAVWFREYRLIYDANGGEGAPAMEHDLTNAGTKTFVLSNYTPTRNGYRFAGWATTPNGAVAYAPGAAVNVTGEADGSTVTTLYAVWNANQYTVTFDAQGGICDTSSASVTFGQPYGELPTPTMDGMVFTGWYTTPSEGGEAVNADTVVTTLENHTLYARWAAQQARMASPQITPDPSVDPTPDPSVDPTPDPTVDPTPDPSVDPTPDPTVDPTPDPSVDPTPDPTVDPTPDPSVDPTPDPTVDPTPDPTAEPGADG